MVPVFLSCSLSRSLSLTPTHLCRVTLLEECVRVRQQPWLWRALSDVE